jgi:hypothetical protein
MKPRLVALALKTALTKCCRHWCDAGHLMAVHEDGDELACRDIKTMMDRGELRCGKCQK